MKKIKLLMSVVLLCTASVVFGQTEVIVSPFKVGTKLTSGDIGFLTMVSKGKLDPSNRPVDPTATLDGINYRTGHVLTVSQVRSLKKSVNVFISNYAGRDDLRKNGMCLYYYLLCSDSSRITPCSYYAGWYHCRS